ncbi:MAG: 2-dehydro-3-deoxygluconokinase [Clostridiales bacterium GWF2_38_85]|nr:MAG: 2-dehydro-3-deoxygluconokinase [Clostridiales bacterium GWF2_38_85]HBL83306.1 2-dehydro-3-deoxygluconokinase [Clostridiales bacterium]
MQKTVTFGEIMLRLQPPSYERILQAKSFDATFGGGEANVAVSLATLDMNAAFVTKLPDNMIGISCRNELRKWGVDTGKIVFGGDRLGIYYCEKGASQRASNVIYDRAGSSVAMSSSEDYDWNSIFEGVDWFHFTGITPALGGNMPEICEQACKAAKQKGITISCDLNYRKKLWSREEAKKSMSNLCQYVDVLIANEEDSESVFGISAPNSNIEGGELSKEGYISVAKQLCDTFKLKKVAITLRKSYSASINGWSGMLFDGKNAFFSKEYTINIVDRVGGGDSFGAGLIYSLLNDKSSSEAIEFAAAASCIKHTIEGDFNICTKAEVEALVKGGGNGRVNR